jgi:hypothetical protein
MTEDLKMGGQPLLVLRSCQNKIMTEGNFVDYVKNICFVRKGGSTHLQRNLLKRWPRW